MKPRKKAKRPPGKKTVPRPQPTPGVAGDPYKTEQWLQMVLDHFPGLVFVKDRDSVILGCNKYFAVAAGKKSPSQVVGKTDYEMGWSKAESDHYRSDDREVMDQGEPKLGIIESQTRPDGQIAWLETSKVPLKDSQGRVIGILGTAHDITERVKAQEIYIAKEAAEAATRAKSRFLAHITHEIRTPLIALLGYSQLLERDTPLNPTQRDYLEIINKAGERLLELINDVLEMAKIETGRVELKPHPFQLHNMVEEVAKLMRVRTLEKGLDFHVEIYPDLPRQVTGDEAKLRQIFLNLLSNAVKFTDKGVITWRLNGRLTREGREGRIRLICEVDDTGVGIKPEELEKLFQTFHQGSLPKGMLKQGTGLGLAISRQFANLMGGDIIVRSVPGMGSCFTAEVVLMENEDSLPLEKPLPRHSSLRVKACPEPVRVLVADDQPDIVMLMRLMLERAGFKVRVAANGREAVAAFEEWRPHLIFLDLGMPVMDGFDAARAIHSHPAGKGAVIVAVSASVFEEERKWLKECGVEWFLPKPFLEAELFQMVEKCLGLSFETTKADTDIEPTR